MQSVPDSFGGVLFPIAAVVLAGMLAGGSPTVLAQSTDPQARVFYGMHNADIFQIRASRDGQRVFSIAADKTLRIWRAADLALQHTVMLPGEPLPFEGMPRALAVSPDGRTVYVGGLTGITWPARASHLYEIDARTGQIRRTLGSFPGAVITAIDLSPDGRSIAVGLLGGGLRTIAADTGEVQWQDPQYRGGEQVMFVHYAPDGALATTATDGCVRVYDPAGTLKLRLEYPKRAPTEMQCQAGSRLGGVRFSPDGRLFAMGSLTYPEVVVFDARTLREVRAVRVDPSRQASLCCIAWSADSRELYVNGEAAAGQPSLIYRIRDPDKPSDATAGIEPMTTVASDGEVISNMLPMADGGMVFSTASPRLARIDRNGAVLRNPLTGHRVEVRPPNIPFRLIGTEDFRISDDGARLSIALGPASGNKPRLARLNLLEPAPSHVLRIDDTHEPGTQPAQRAGRVRVETALGRRSYESPARINGVDLPRDPTGQSGLWPHEGVYSWSNHPDRDVVVLGTSLRVVAFDGSGRRLWDRWMPSTVHHVAITADGRYVVAAIGDGTIRWLRLTHSVERSDHPPAVVGDELFSLFVHQDGGDWVSFLPDGSYSSSPEGDRYVGWLVNRGPDRNPDFHRALHYERVFFRPEAIPAAFSPRSETLRRTPPYCPQQVGGAGNAGIRSLGDCLRALASPRVRIDAVTLARRDDRATAQVDVTIESTGRPIREIGVYVDRIPVLQSRDRVVSGDDQLGLRRRFEVPLLTSGSLLRVEAESDLAIGSAETIVPLPAQAPVPVKGKLWILAAGVDRFDESQEACRRPGCKGFPNLRFASNDAVRLAEALAEAASGLYREVDVQVLSDRTGQRASKRNLLAAFQRLAQARSEDSVVVFLSSHGTTAPGGRYLFYPADARFADYERATQPSSAATPPLSSVLTSDELLQFFRRVPGRRLLIVDTCHAGDARGDRNTYTLAKRSMASDVAFMAASGSDELSWEADTLEHGAFTFALLAEIRKRDGRTALTPLTVREAFDSARRALPKYLPPGVRQTPDLRGPASVLSGIALAVR